MKKLEIIRRISLAFNMSPYVSIAALALPHKKAHPTLTLARQRRIRRCARDLGGYCVKDWQRFFKATRFKRLDLVHKYLG